MDEPLGFSAVLQRAQLGESSALQALMEQFRGLVTGICRRYQEFVDADVSTSDLTQEAWLRIWLRMDEFEGAVDDDELTLIKFRSWIRKVTRHVVLNILEARSAQRRQPPHKLMRLDGQLGDGSSTSEGMAVPDGDKTPSERAAAVERTRGLRQAVSRIEDPLARKIVELRLYEDMSLRQICRELNETFGRVRRRFDAALAFLERELGETL